MGGGGGGVSSRASIFSRGAGSYESNRNTVEFSRKSGFRVYKTMSKVKMFE